MAYLIASNIVLAACLIVSIITGIKERKFLIGIIASRDYADYKLTENISGTKREYKTPLKRRAEREKQFDEQE